MLTRRTYDFPGIAVAVVVFAHVIIRARDWLLLPLFKIRFSARIAHDSVMFAGGDGGGWRK